VSRPARAALLGAALAALALVAGCGSGSGKPQVTFTVGGQDRTVGPAQFCDLKLSDCSQDATAQVKITVPPGTPIGITVPDEVSGAPWHVVFAYTGPDGRTEGRSPVFAPQAQKSYTLTLPDPADRLETAQVQLFGPAPTQDPQTGEIEFPVRGTWLLVSDAG
jgi:Protein of unknown function (DUF2771)